MSSHFSVWRFARRLFFVVSATAFAIAPALAADILPLSIFFTNDDILDVRISPSGRHLALTVPATTGRMVLAVVELGTDKPPVVVAQDARADIRSF